ncbi:tetratricopeptide repeat protein [Brachyspira pilosicoli]|uniref:Tetratricopeptide repeat protein n=1 Tax=Brachyspira pilosicoli TaxID=52584 RepID=A0AAJ6KDR3_BRAPL|nr:tetratricopeptide repeat protein [Brachyspira pilosicoli]WIH90176.1 tetratricopeptide repeat protein [Brachyspira pilosicoli]WIH92467.1 tetratricopeptide repeat protein [Brachyspira pilosicoli]WIH94759.1 tetratricopeptide repeat protein [Brachyspira pilosicoli]
MTKEILELINQKKYEEAIKLCDKYLLSNDNKNNITFLFFHKAKCYYDLSLLENNDSNLYYYEAIKNWSIVIDIIPYKNEAKEAYFNIGLTYRNLAIKNNYFKNYLELAIYYFSKNLDLLKRNEEETIKDFDLETLNKKYKSVHSELGVSYAILGNYIQSIDNFNKVTSIEPYNKNAYYNRFLSYYYLAKYDNYNYYTNALNDISKLIELDSNNYRFFYYKGLILFNLKNYKEAIDYYKKAIKLTCNYNQKIIIYTEIIESLYLNKEIFEIEKLYNKLSRIYKKFLYSYDIYTNKLFSLYVSFISKLKIKADFNFIDELILKDFNANLNDEIKNNTLYNYTILDKDRLKSVLNGQLWVGNTNKFNDPIDPVIKRNRDNEAYNYLLEKIKVSCLTMHNDNTLMWSHYSDKHQGICIEYDISNISKRKEIIFKKIKYHTKMNRYNSFTSNDDLTIRNFVLDEYTEINYIIESFTIKSKEWEYEDEYRILFYDEKNENPNGRSIDLPIKSICFGVQTSKEDKELVYNIVNSINEKRIDYNNDIIKLYQAELDDNELFKINIKPYEHEKN